MVATCILVAGCANFASKEAFAACRGADALSTLTILERGGRELNPVMAKVLSVGGAPLFVALQAAFVWWAWGTWDERSAEANGALTAVSCLPVLHNVGQL